jgi:pentatricopeptide repeat protein
MIRNGLSVSANTFRDLISGFWRLQDLEGAEKVFGLMQAAGHQPELKVLQLAFFTRSLLF